MVPVFRPILTLLLLALSWEEVVGRCTQNCPSASGCTHLSNINNGYCGSTSYRPVSRQGSRYSTQHYNEYYYISCGFWGWDRCRKSRDKTRSVRRYYTDHLSERVCSQFCCSGYTGSAPSCRALCGFTCANGGRCTSPNVCTCASGWTGTTCTSAICGFTCANGGRCTSPNVCTCASGWTGTICTTAVCSVACSNGGRCSRPNVCSCATGWSGSTCTTAICSPSCANGGACTAPGSCSCAAEWSGVRCEDPVCNPGCANGGKCTAPNTCSCTAQWTGSTCAADVDECTSGAHNCEHSCINKAGTFRCECNAGYELDVNGYQCKNVDECLRGTHDCSQLCTDNVGSFTCSCQAGYQLNGRTQCDDINECLTNPCDHSCTNNVGSFDCGCNVGYRLQGSTTCVDIDECTERTKPCAQNCANNMGSFTCSCRNGFTLDQDGLTCNDIDECANGANECTQNCQNTMGGFYCYCDAGFVLASVDKKACEKFELNSAMNTPTEPLNLGFLNSIKDGLAMCMSGPVCTCIHELFEKLSELGFAREAIQTMGDSFTIIMSSEEQQSISDLVLAIFGADSSIVLPVVANIRELGYDCTNQEFTIETFQAGGDMQIFPNIMTLSDLNLRVSVSTVWSNPTLESLRVMGTFDFGSLTLNTFVETIDPDVWTFGATLGPETEVNVIELIASAIGVDIPSKPFGDLITLTDISMKGLVDVAANFKFFLVFQSTVRISTWYEDNVCLIIHQGLSDSGRLPPQLGFISGCVEADSISFSSVIEGITSIDLSGIGFFENLQLPRFHIIYTSSNFTFDEPRLGYSDLEFASDFAIPGFKFIFDFYVSEDEFKSWIFFRGPQGFKFQPMSPNTDSFSLGEIVSLLSDALSLPSVELLASELTGLILQDMDLDLDKKSLALTIKVPEVISIFIDSFTVSELTISFHLNIDGGITFHTFSLSGIIMLGDSTFDVSIAYDSGEYELSASASDFGLGFSGIASALGSSFTNSIAVSTFGFGGIGLYDPSFAMKFKPGMLPEYMCFAADLFRSDFADVVISACITKEKKWVFGFEICEFIIAKLLSQFIGGVGKQIAFFNQELFAAVIIAPISVSNLPLQGVLYDELDRIIKGTTIIASTGWPDSCSSDPFCVVARGLLGEDLKVFLIVQMAGSLVGVEAKVKNFKIGDFILSAASIQMEFGPGLFSVGIAAEMDISNLDITLIGALRLKFPQAIVSLEFAARGCWVNAFGISILDICDFFIQVSIRPGSPLPGLAFGATVKIGKKECYVFEATGFFGICPNDPTGNYFYVNVGPITLQLVLDMFCSSLTLPEFLGGTGFPKGFTASFAAQAVFLRHVSIIIKQGFYFKGTLNIFGLTIESEITLDPPRLIEIFARLSPLNIAGGLLKMYESRDVTDKGPFLYIKVQSSPPRFEAEASGYINVLGIEAEAMLTVSSAGYQVYVYGNIFGVLEAELYIKAHIGKIIDASYRVVGKIAISILCKIQEAVVGALQKAAKAADEAISGAQEKVRAANADFDRAVAAFQPVFDRLRNARNKLASIRNNLGRLRNSVCQYRSCGSICVPFFCGCGCAKRVLGVCVWPCLRWSSCSFRITDPICLGYNAGCFLIRIPIEILILAAQLALRVAEGVLYSVEGIVRAAQLIVDAARFVLVLTNLALQAIKLTITIGLKALSVVTKFLLTGIIDIREIGFDVHIALFDHGSISVYLDASFFSQPPVHLSLTLPIFNPLALVGGLVERAVPGLGRTRRYIPSAEKVAMLAHHFKTTGSIYPSPY